jgi:hypothetical protein
MLILKRETVYLHLSQMRRFVLSIGNREGIDLHRERT